MKSASRRREDHRRLDPQRVAPEAALSDQEPQVLARLEDRRALLLGGLLGPAVLDELDAEHEARGRGCRRSGCASRRASRIRPCRWRRSSSEFAWRPSRSITSRTARPWAQATGLPPKVLKWIREARAWAIFGVVTTAARAQPLPMPFAMVTMSGMTPWVSKPQKWVPVLPKPDWTSSAMQRPPAARDVLVGVLQVAVGVHDGAADALDGLRDESRDRARRSRTGSGSRRPRRTSCRPRGRPCRRARGRGRAGRHAGRRSCAAR